MRRWPVRDLITCRSRQLWNQLVVDTVSICTVLQRILFQVLQVLDATSANCYTTVNVPGFVSCLELQVHLECMAETIAGVCWVR